MGRMLYRRIFIHLHWGLFLVTSLFKNEVNNSIESIQGWNEAYTCHHISSCNSMNWSVHVRNVGWTVLRKFLEFVIWVDSKSRMKNSIKNHVWMKESILCYHIYSNKSLNWSDIPVTPFLFLYHSFHPSHHTFFLI